ncbi:hypothetical protein QE391_005208 [Pseudomonas fluorescens]|nr:hypothetical protein [Pseudomonas fluorescens]
MLAGAYAITHPSSFFPSDPLQPKMQSKSAAKAGKELTLHIEHWSRFQQELTPYSFY